MPRMPKGTPTGYFINGVELKLGDKIKGPLGIGFVHCTKVQFENKTIMLEELDCVLDSYEITDEDLGFKLFTHKKTKAKTADELVKQILDEPAKPTNDEEWRRSAKVIEDKITAQDEARLIASSIRVGEFASSKRGTGIVTKIHGDRVTVAAFVTEDGIEDVATIGFKSLKYSTRFDKINWDVKLRSQGLTYDSDDHQLHYSTGQLLSPGDYVEFDDDSGVGMGILKEITRYDDKPYTYTLVAVKFGHHGTILEEFNGRSPLTLCDPQKIRKYNALLTDAGIIVNDDFSLKKVVRDPNPTEKPTGVLLSDATETQIQQELKKRGFKGQFRKEYDI